MLDWYIIGLFKQTANQEQFLISIPLELLHEQHPAPVPCYQNILLFFIVKLLLELTFQTEPGDYQRDMSSPVEGKSLQSRCLEDTNSGFSKANDL